MIRKILVFALVFCLFVPPAGAAIWPFGKKKEDTPKEDTRIFNRKTDPNNPDKKWVLDGIFDPKKPDPDLIINGQTIRGLKAHMLNASYIPKNPEEIAMVAYAHKGWEAGAMKQMEQAARARIAAAQKKADDALRKMQIEGLQQLVGGIKPMPSEPAMTQPAGGEEKKPVRTELFNRPDLDAPSKVFKNYR